MLNNPWAQPPEPCDWDICPTYSKTVVPYFLAPLWDVEIAARKEAEQKRRIARARANAGLANIKNEAVGYVPRDLRQKLKKAGLEDDIIETVYGLGYRLKPSPEVAAEPAPKTNATKTQPTPEPHLPNSLQRWHARSRMSSSGAMAKSSAMGGRRGSDMGKPVYWEKARQSRGSCMLGMRDDGEQKANVVLRSGIVLCCAKVTRR